MLEVRTKWRMGDDTPLKSFLHFPESFRLSFRKLANSNPGNQRDCAHCAIWAGCGRRRSRMNCGGKAERISVDHAENKS